VIANNRKELADSRSLVAAANRNETLTAGFVRLLNQGPVRLWKRVRDSHWIRVFESDVDMVKRLIGMELKFVEGLIPIRHVKATTRKGFQFPLRGFAMRSKRSTG